MSSNRLSQNEASNVAGSKQAPLQSSSQTPSQIMPQISPQGSADAPQEQPQQSPMMQLIGDILLQKELITQRDLTQALAMQSEVAGLLGQALLRLGAVTEEELLRALSMQLAMPIADVISLPIEPASYGQGASLIGLTTQWMVAHQAFIWIEYLEASPVEADPMEMGVAAGEKLNNEGEQENKPKPIKINILAADPLNIDLRETLESILATKIGKVVDLNNVFSGGNDSTQDNAQDNSMSESGVEEDGEGLVMIESYQYHLAANQTIEMSLSRLQQYQARDNNDDGMTDAARLREMAEEAPVIDFVNNLFAVAIKDNASDIHIEAFEHSFLVRYRIDGVLHTRQNQSRSQFDAVASRIKLIAGMDIAERRLPQDGRHTIRFAGNDIDLRVSSMPSTWGESIVMRLLRKQAELPDLEGLGLMGRSETLLNEILSMPNGVFLVTGPTGSGKSTTLYRSLEQINDGYRKIITIEDPVEYDIEGITQIQVKADIGYDFANGLRSMLRQDPDVIMVGEIRDGETATIAAQASLTGHFVLSTLHTNSSLAAITRLEDIGLERFLISASVRGLMAQRLVRRLCPACSIASSDKSGDTLVTQAVKAGADFGSETNGKAQWREAVGCDACDQTGYRGRIAVFEIAKIDDDLREAIINGVPLTQVFTIARRQGFLTLLEDGLMKARQGFTTVKEVHRVCGGDAG